MIKQNTYLGLLATLWIFQATAIAADNAKEILGTTGIKGGLVVHLGCGDGSLTAALHAGDAFLVQGLDTRPEKVGIARRQIQSLGFYGAVSVNLVWVMDKADGKKRHSLELESAPVFDGMIAANRRLYLSNLDGRVICLGAEE